MRWVAALCVCAVAQAATDVLKVSNEARRTQVTSEVEETLFSSTTHLDEHKFYTIVSKGVEVRVKAGTYTSEVEETLKCKSKNRDPYILFRVVCAHMVRAP